MKKLETVTSQIPEKIQGMITDYKEDIEAAWLKREDGEDITLNFSAKLGFKDGRNRCEVSISFVKEKIRDKTEFTWDEKQMSLF